MAEDGDGRHSENTYEKDRRTLDQKQTLTIGWQYAVFTLTKFAGLLA